MNKSASYLIDSLIYKREKKLDNIHNRRNLIDLDDFFKNSGKIEINGTFVRACRYVLPILSVPLVKNDMRQYQLNKKKK